MRTRILALTLALIATLAPAAADAKLPPKGGKLIVPGVSIGGVKVGMKAEDAAKKWGKGGSCDETTVGAVSCRYEGTLKQGRMRFDLRDGKVTTVSIQVGQRSNGEAIYKGPITKWHTKKGVRIGSPLNKIAKKYPKAKTDGGGLELSGRKNTTFFSSSGGRAFSIDIVANSQL